MHNQNPKSADRSRLFLSWLILKVYHSSVCLMVGNAAWCIFPSLINLIWSRDPIDYKLAIS